MKDYKEIKKELLGNEDIYEVSIDSAKKKIKVVPVQNKSFYDIDEPLEKYMVDNHFVIGGREFKRCDYNRFNTQIYEITIKEI